MMGNREHFADVLIVGAGMSGIATASEMAQAFFVKLLERRDIAGLKQENGRFRASCLRRSNTSYPNERDRAGRLKRGGNITHLSLDWQSADAQFQIVDRSHLSPDAANDREWAVVDGELSVLLGAYG